MGFVVTSDFDENTEMYPGMIITYKIAPLFSIKMNWMTEITHVKENEYFVDEQRTGPYALWHHEHHFKVIKGGVEMTAKLTYGIPFGIFGRLANSLFVGKKVKEIFDYRKNAIEKMFGVLK